MNKRYITIHSKSRRLLRAKGWVLNLLGWRYHGLEIYSDYFEWWSQDYWR